MGKAKRGWGTAVSIALVWLMLPAAAGAQAFADPDTGTASAGATDAAAAQRGRLGAWMHDIVGPGALIGIAAGTAYAQWRNYPAEWGTGGSGLGKRVASVAGDLVISESVRHGLAAGLGRSTDYVHCSCRDLGGRIGNAVSQTFTDRDAGGARRFSVPRIAGAVAGGFAPMAWTPNEKVGTAIGASALGLVFAAAGNLFSEYVPW